jgi:hypothetical protein
MNQKHLLITLLAILATPLGLLAGGPWSEFWDSPPIAGSPAALACVYVQAARLGNLDECRTYMTRDYEAWLERVGGVENCLDVFINADLEKRFAWRQSLNGDTATVWIRVHVTTRGREVNVALNLVRINSRWKLTK